MASTPVKGLELNYSFGYTHATFDELKLSQNGSVVDLHGNHQVFTPDMTSMLAAQYSYAPGKQIKLVARGEWRYLGSTWFDLANTIKQSPYSLLNASLGIRRKNFSITCWEGISLTKSILPTPTTSAPPTWATRRHMARNLGVKF